MDIMQLFKVNDGQVMANTLTANTGRRGITSTCLTCVPGAISCSHLRALVCNRLFDHQPKSDTKIIY